MADENLTNETILLSAVQIPNNVVYRAFVKETVVLNLESGRYHGLNPTAGRMLEVLERSPTAGEAANYLAEEFGREPAEIEGDLCDLCRGLLERGLVTLKHAPDPADA
jgi:Coenzyme PQQ synthesis protein D (PqqD)